MSATFNPLILGLGQPSGLSDYAAIGAFSLAVGTYLLKGKAWDKPDPYHHVYFEKPQVSDAASSGKPKETRDIAVKLEETDNQVVIFWGSQSGTAEGFANRLSREFHSRFRINSIAVDLSDYDSESIANIGQDKLAIFIVSTFGEGDPSDNTAGLWQWLHTAKASLANLRYFAFGLGNSNYKYYNKVIDVIVESLDTSGATRLTDVGRADDAKGTTEEDFIAWRESLFSYFKNTLSYEEYDVLYQPAISVVEDDSLEPIDLHQGEPIIDNKSSVGTSAIKAIPIKEMRDLSSTSAGRNCLHADLDLSSFPELTYKTGDHLSVWPSNPDAEVQRILTQLGRLDSADIPISIKSLDASKIHVPTPTTLSVLLRYYLEICAPVSRDTVAQLVQFAPTPAAKAFVKTLSTDREAYAAFVARTHVSFGRLLEISTASEPAAWATLPLSFLVEVISPIKPRHYSISSSSTVSPRHPSITAVVAQTPLADPTASSITIPGLATNFLLSHHTNSTDIYNLDGPQNALQGRKVYAQIRKSKFKLPAMSSQAIIMIAAGTGIAPFRGFLQERARMKTMGKTCGKMILFFGCRHPDQDFLYKDELLQLQETLKEELTIVTAFSRVQGQEAKIYVQDRVRESQDVVFDMLTESNSNVYICGSAAMAREVGNVISGCMKERNGWSDEETKAWTESKKKTRKFQEDVWG